MGELSHGDQRMATILAVDDSNSFSKSIHPALARRGFPVYCATSPDEGLKQFQEHSSEIDLAVLDMVTPGAGSIDLAAELERLRPGLPVLYLVGSQSTIARASIEAQSPGSVLVAPFTEEQFMARINGLLEIESPGSQPTEAPSWEQLIATPAGTA